MKTSKDLAFSIEIDLVQMTDVHDHLLIEGFLGELNHIELIDGLLTLKGDEGTLRLQLAKELETLVH
jgi:hypothetical protein